MKPLKIFILSLILLVAFFLIGGQTLTYEASNDGKYCPSFNA
ncbi:MAG: hypothetical protein QNJ08_16120 [Crocosphaera sp.]|nr:hypothetical protein [Crocosphaera sp.]